MAGIYIPSGAAREYSPLALNHIHGCDSGCNYCYVPKIMKRFDSDYVHSNVWIKEESALLKELEKSFKEHQNSPHQVFLSFLTDPYSHFNKVTNITRKVLEMLLEYRIPVSILTKGGANVLDDLDVILKFGHNIQVGASLTFINDYDSKKWEKNAALPAERLLALKVLHDQGVLTWASMEPVIFPDQSLALMEMTYKYVNRYKIGKLNHFKNYEDKIDYGKFIIDAVNVMRSHRCVFYIKKDLLEFKPSSVKLVPHETDMDYLALGAWKY